MDCITSFMVTGPCPQNINHQDNHFRCDPDHPCALCKYYFNKGMRMPTPNKSGLILISQVSLQIKASRKLYLGFTEASKMA